MFAIRTRYEGPTDKTGSRIIATALEQPAEGQRCRHLAVSYPYDISGDCEIHRYALTRFLHQLRMQYIKAFVDACDDKEKALGRAWVTSSHYNPDNWASGFDRRGAYVHVYAGEGFQYSRDLA